MGSYGEAVHYYRLYLQDRPDDVRSLLNMGAALAEMGNYREAMDYFHKVLILNPNHELAQKNLELLEKILNDTDHK
jgi:tetratricopeptide (TPR) repeat protein